MYSCVPVCMDEEWGRSTIKGLVDTPGQDKRPETFYFGDFHDDIDRCKRACLLEPECYRWVEEDFTYEFYFK